MRVVFGYAIGLQQASRADPQGEHKMRYAKNLGLAVLALAALMTITSTASASSVTSPKGTTYTSTIKAANEGNVTLTSAFGGFGAITCTNSTFEGKVEQHGASVTTIWTIYFLSLTGCSGGEFTSPVATPGSIEVHAPGTATTRALIVIIHKTLFGTCTFSDAAGGTNLGTITDTSVTGGNATLDAKATLSSSCGNGTFEGTYKITTPSALYID
jgi:hypothetical protein